MEGHGQTGKAEWGSTSGLGSMFRMANGAWYLFVVGSVSGALEEAPHFDGVRLGLRAHYLATN